MRSSARCARSTQPNPGWRHEREDDTNPPPGSRISVAALAMPVGYRRCVRRTCHPAVVRGECLIDGRLPNTRGVLRPVATNAEPRSSSTLWKHGYGNVTAPATASCSNSSHITWSRAVVEADTERERNPASKGGGTNANGRAREAQTEVPAEPERDYPGDFQVALAGARSHTLPPREEDRNVAVSTPWHCGPAGHARRRETAGHPSGGVGVSANPCRPVLRPVAARDHQPPTRCPVGQDGARAQRDTAGRSNARYARDVGPPCSPLERELALRTEDTRGSSACLGMYYRTPRRDQRRFRWGRRPR
jgi:hypothetical protein